MEFHTAVQPYLDELAAGTAAPGGGSAAAATGAMGAALVCMVCNLTIGRSKFADVDAQMQTILEQAEALRAELTQLISDDPAAYSAIMDAYRLPKETDAEKAERRAAIQASTKRATLTPLATARACAEVLELCQAVAELGNPNAVSDAGSGAACAQAGLKAAALNVLINLPSIKDEEFVADCRSQLDQILVKQALADEVHELVKSQIA
jgi:formiminotetrahydrofolate cyclodeaminase